MSASGFRSAVRSMVRVLRKGRTGGDGGLGGWHGSKFLQRGLCAGSEAAARFRVVRATRRSATASVGPPKGFPRRSDVVVRASAALPGGPVGVVQGTVTVCGVGRPAVTGTAVAYHQELASASLGPPNNGNVRRSSAVLLMKLMRGLMY